MLRQLCKGRRGRNMLDPKKKKKNNRQSREWNTRLLITSERRELSQLCHFVECEKLESRWETWATVGVIWGFLFCMYTFFYISSLQPRATTAAARPSTNKTKRDFPSAALNKSVLWGAGRKKESWTRARTQLTSSFCRRLLINLMLLSSHFPWALWGARAKQSS